MQEEEERKGSLPIWSTLGGEKGKEPCNVLGSERKKTKEPCNVLGSERKKTKELHNVVSPGGAEGKELRNVVSPGDGAAGQCFSVNLSVILSAHLVL